MKWINSAIAFVRAHAKRMREPVDWTPAAAEKPQYSSDHRGNVTVRAHQQTTALRAADASGRDWVILEIVPIEPVQGYSTLRFVRGRARYELKDGTPVVQCTDRVFEVGGTTLTIKS